MSYVANIAGLHMDNPQRVVRKLGSTRRMYNQQQVGATQQQTGVQLMAVAPTLAAVPVVGWIAAAGAELVGVFLKVFGSNYSTSTGVRWLCQYYEKYVLGLNTRSDNTVNEANVPSAQKWFSYVLGVPIYDTYRFCALKGWDHNSETDLKISDQQRINNYLAFPDCASTDPKLVAQAVQIAKTLNWTDPLGSWKNRLPAPGLITSTAVNSSTPVGVQPAGSGPAPAVGQPSNNTIWWVLGAAVATYAGWYYLYGPGKTKGK